MVQMNQKNIYRITPSCNIQKKLCYWPKVVKFVVLQAGNAAYKRHFTINSIHRLCQCCPKLLWGSEPTWYSVQVNLCRQHIDTNSANNVMNYCSYAVQYANWNLQQMVRCALLIQNDNTTTGVTAKTKLAGHNIYQIAEHFVFFTTFSKKRPQKSAKRRPTRKRSCKITRISQIFSSTDVTDKMAHSLKLA